MKNVKDEDSQRQEGKYGMAWCGVVWYGVV